MNEGVQETSVSEISLSIFVWHAKSNSCKKNLNTFFNTKLSIFESNMSNFGMFSAY
jgi:hypothetical protein